MKFGIGHVWTKSLTAADASVKRESGQAATSSSSPCHCLLAPVRRLGPRELQVVVRFQTTPSKYAASLEDAVRPTQDMYVWLFRQSLEPASVGLMIPVNSTSPCSVPRTFLTPWRFGPIPVNFWWSNPPTNHQILSKNIDFCHLFSPRGFW